MPFGKMTKSMLRTKKYRKYTKKVYKSIPKDQEFKTIDLIGETSSCNTTGEFTLLNALARGTDYDERVGRQVTVKSIQIKGVIQATPETGTDQLQRVMIFVDNDTDGAPPTGADLIQGFNNAFEDVYNPRNLNNRDRFRVLYDRTFVMNKDTKDPCKRIFKYYKRLNQAVLFNAGNAGTEADIQKGAIWIFTYGTNAAGGTAGNAGFSSRIRFIDN